MVPLANSQAFANKIHLYIKPSLDEINVTWKDKEEETKIETEIEDIEKKTIKNPKIK